MSLINPVKFVSFMQHMCEKVFHNKKNNNSMNNGEDQKLYVEEIKYPDVSETQLDDDADYQESLTYVPDITIVHDTMNVKYNNKTYRFDNIGIRRIFLRYEGEEPLTVREEYAFDGMMRDDHNPYSTIRIQYNGYHRDFDVKRHVAKVILAAMIETRKRVMAERMREEGLQRKNQSPVLDYSI